MLGDSIARVATRGEYDEMVELAADRSGGTGRQMLVYALWRVKTPRSRELILELIEDPDVAGHAIHSLRRAFGNDEARRRLEPLLEHPDGNVRGYAVEGVKRIDKAPAR